MRRVLAAAVLGATAVLGLGAAGAVEAPAAFLGFRVGADNRLARWDRIVDYMKAVADGSDRVRYEELGTTTNGQPFVLLEISAPDTLNNLDRYRALERRLYYQGGAPSAAEREAIFNQGKVVVLVTCSIHATEIGATQMSLELVHRLATDDSPEVRKILDNVIFLLVPSLNPDGQVLVTDWFDRNKGTEFANSPIPYLYHPYAGHDNNRDMYMFNLAESRWMAELLWHDWFPAVWLDEHEMGRDGPRIFVMPATDPINLNVHPLIYRWNAILGQSQAAALEAEGKTGIIYNSTYTNFWEGAMAWSGWWHNQIGLLTEVAGVRIAAPVDQQRATLNQPPDPERRSSMYSLGNLLPPPTDVMARTEYPRPWLGGHWSLRDIVDYELTATMALLDTAADRREAILRQIYAVNEDTIAEGRSGKPSAILIPARAQHDAREVAHLVSRLLLGGIEVYRADEPFAADRSEYAAGTFVVPMAQVFGRYAKDLLEVQRYPDMRPTGDTEADAPYDVTAWTLGMQMGVRTAFVSDPLPASLPLTRVTAEPRTPGEVRGAGSVFTFPYEGADSAIVVNRLLQDGAAVTLETTVGGGARAVASGESRGRMETLARTLGVHVVGGARPGDARPGSAMALRTPRIGLYQPFTGDSVDEGWTRWVLEQYEFPFTTVHNADLRGGGLNGKFDAILIADQDPQAIVEGFDSLGIRPEYRGGIGQQGLDALQQFVLMGGTLVTLGRASDLVIEHLPVPVRDVKRGLTRDEHFAPGAILRVQVDTQHPMGYGMPRETYGFYDNSPFFTVGEGFASWHTAAVARYPNTDVLASGWLKGEALMQGRPAVVSIETNPGRIIMFGLAPQHRGQTHATFPLLFNALYLSALDGPAPSGTTQ